MSEKSYTENLEWNIDCGISKRAHNIHAGGMENRGVWGWKRLYGRLAEKTGLHRRYIISHINLLNNPSQNSAYQLQRVDHNLVTELEETGSGYTGSATKGS